MPHEKVKLAKNSVSNTIRIGASQTDCYIAGINGVTIVAGAVPVVIGSTGQLGTVSSSRRFKHDISSMDDDSANILKLDPVTFVYNSDDFNTKQYGLIAEEVNEVFPDIVVRDENGNPYTVQYHVLPVLLLNEMKTQQLSLETQQVSLEAQQETIENLSIIVDSMNEAINSLQKQVQQFVKRT